MTRRYTRSQIVERLNYWKKLLNESFGSVPQNPDDWKADDGFVGADEYEEQQKYGAYGLNYETMWNDFKKAYDNSIGLFILFEVDGDIKKIQGFTNLSGVLKVDLAPKNPSKYPGITSKDFFNELASYGLKANAIKKIEANFSGKTYDLNGYQVENYVKYGSVFIFKFGNCEKLSETIRTDAGSDGAPDRFKQVDPVEYRGIRGFITVGDVLEAIDNAFAGQENAILNYGPEGKILGQVNCIFADKKSGESGTCCVMTLAPYKNGRRSVDCSVAGNRNSPLDFDQIKKILATLDKNMTVKIRYKDPLAFGPKAGQVIEQLVGNITIDRIFGIFMRPAENAEPQVVFQQA